jgi:YmgG-like glycine-zipper protein
MVTRLLAPIVGLSMIVTMTTACGTVTGGAIGAGTGAAVAAGTGNNVGKGALIGAGVGAAGGAIYDITKHR